MKKIAAWVFIVTIALSVAFASVGIINHSNRQDSALSNSVSASVQELQTDMSQLYLQKEDFEQESSRVQVELEDKQSQLDTNREQTISLQSEVENLEQTIAAKNSQLELADDELRQQLEFEVGTLETQLADKQAQLDSLFANASAQQEEIDALSSEVEDLQATLDTRTAQLEASDADLRTLVETEVATLEGELEDKQLQLDTLSNKMTLLQSQVDDLAVRLSDINSKITEIEGDIEAIQQSIADLYNKVAINDRSILTATLASNFAIPAGTATKVTNLTEFAEVGTMLDLWNHDIYVGAGVSHVLISANVIYSGVSHGSYIVTYIYKNGNVVGQVRANAGNGSYCTTSLTPFLLEVAHGDAIGLTCYSSEACQVFNDNNYSIARTYLTVEVVA